MRGTAPAGKYLMRVNDGSIQRREDVVPVLVSSSTQATTMVGTSCWCSPMVIVDDAWINTSRNGAPITPV